MEKILDKLQKAIVSTRTMAMLLLVYAASMAVATFVENDYGTPTAKALIYEAKWFELVMLLLMINFVGNIKRYQLYKRGKWPLLVFHLSFIIIFIGGAITRYISFEGSMNIREGKTSNQIVSEKQYFKIQIEEKGDVLNYADVPYIFSPLHHNFKASYGFRNKKVEVKALNYLQRKKDSLHADPNGKAYLHMVSAGESGRINYYLTDGDVKSINGVLVAYNRQIEGAVQISNQQGNLKIQLPQKANYLTMATQKGDSLAANTSSDLKLRSLYTMDKLKLVFPEMPSKGKLVAYEGDKKKDKEVANVLTLEIKGPKTTQVVEVPSKKGDAELYKQVSIDGLNILVAYGSKIFTTPFQVKLDKFAMITYPGSTSPSSFESFVKIIDEGKETPHHIYMNNILDHKGYRLFQSSFDADRKGTVLQVNHDFWGTWITYIGYFLLFGGLFVSLFWKGTHFWKIGQQLSELSKKKIGVIVLLLSMTFGLNAQEHSEHDGHNHAKTNAQQHSPSTHEAPSQNTAPSMPVRNVSVDEILAKTKINPEHAQQFGYLLVQSFDGRIQPMSTQALEVLRKLYKKDKFHSLTANQWFIAINTDPYLWTQVPLIKIGNKGGDELKQKCKANADGYTSLVNLFPSKNGQMQYVLEEDYKEAFGKKPAAQSEFDKEVININDRVQVFNGILSGQYLRVVPVKNDPNNTWNSWQTKDFQPDMASRDVIGPYFFALMQAQKNNQWLKANAELENLKNYQHKWGKNVAPSDNKIALEVYMNELNINLKLLMYYTVVGLLLLVLSFWQLFQPKAWLKVAIKSMIILGSIGFVAHFLGLAGRWYITGHAPWSNGYEAIVFISWVGILAGLVLYRNSNALIPSAGFLVAVTIMGFAHGGAQLDPQITPLVPVLKSYWLIVHVAIIVSSYAFFALSAIISIITMLFWLITNHKNFIIHQNKTIKEIAIVSEMSLHVGLFLLTVGTFLGGIWANESWGRYWSWDPKETWAFISVMIYAFVLHMRLVPGLRGRFTITLVTLLAFSTMIMTYYGVNYYLSGLHSYAAGDPVPVPGWVYVALAVVFVFAVASYFKYRILKQKTAS
jgi:cytochrome c-type biogenesis protein CcsB